MLFWSKLQNNKKPKLVSADSSASQQKSWHSLDYQACLNQLSSDKNGLSSAEAKSRLKKNGYNKVKKAHHFETLKILARQFQDLLVVLLIFTTGISWYLKDTRTTTVLIIIIVINIIIGFFEEYRADKVMKSLQSLLKPTAKALRDGVPIEVDAQQLVVGDIVMVEAGDSVPADLRLLQVDGLLTNDYALTGESTPTSCITAVVRSSAPVAERDNMIYMGTTVAAGVGRGVVVSTGMQTELGTIARLSEEAKPDRSPLQKEISHLALRITQGTIVLITILVPISLGASFGLREAFLFAIGIAAAMIPQGLPAEVNVALAQAAGKLAKSRVLVKRLTAVETLGATQIICTDKTGTLTKNEMTVTSIFSLDGTYKVEGTGFIPKGRIIDSSDHPLSQSELLKLKPLIVCGFMASNASIHEPDTNHPNWYSIGDPTEAALVSLAQKTNFSKAGAIANIIKQFPFDSDRKRMSVVANEAGQKYVFAKGSPESILGRSTHILHNGKIISITRAHRNKIEAYIAEMSSQAMRNIAQAYRPIKSELPKSSDEAEQGLVFLGITAMIDPPREEVLEAMLAAYQANMLVTIITGDEARTASAIAQQIGFAQSKKPILVNHNALVKMADSKVSKLVMTGRAIFARASPSDKLRIVNILKKSGYILAVTGDGINDAPALKRADIGVAMGKIGSDVAKDSSEIILLDDSFHTLVGAIEQGRVIFQNIKKTVLSCITSNFAELTIVLLSLGLGAVLAFPFAISVTQILAIDLMAELFPLAALGWDPPTSNIMNDKPRNIKNHIMSNRAILDVVSSGFIIGSLAYLGFLVTFMLAGSEVVKNSPVYLQATTVTYTTIVLCQFVNILARRTAPNKSIFSRYLFTNWHLWAAFGVSMTGVFMIIYVPILARFIGNSPISLSQWGISLTAAAIYLLIRELAKLKSRVTQKKIKPALAS